MQRDQPRLTLKIYIIDLKEILDSEFLFLQLISFIDGIAKFDKFQCLTKSFMFCVIQNALTAILNLNFLLKGL